MKILLLILLSISLLFATDYELDQLVNDFEIASDYSNVTKDESMGNMVVFTRKDIDQIHAKIVTDIFRSLKFTNQTQSWKGTSGLSPYGFLSSYPFPVRLYINNIELSSVYADSPFSMYDNISLSLIDHIEVYFMSSSIRKGSVPSLITIKMYTKEANRNENGSLTLTTSNRGDASLSVFKAIKLEKDEKVTLFLNQATYKGLEFKNNGQMVNSKQDEFTHFYTDYTNENHKITLNYAQTKRGMLFGRSVDGAPDNDTYHDFQQMQLAYDYDFNDVKISASYMYEHLLHDEKNKQSEGGIFKVGKFPNIESGKYLTSIYAYRKYQRFHLNALKDFKTHNNIFTVGLSLGRKTKKIIEKRFTINEGTEQNANDAGISNINNMSVFIENVYDINKDNKIFFSLKFDDYKGNGLYLDNQDYITKVGFISSLAPSMTLKTFLTRTYRTPSFIIMNDSKAGLPNLEFKFLSSELKYSLNKHSFSGTLVAASMTNYIMDVTTGYTTPQVDKENFKILNLVYSYDFTPRKSLTLNYDKFLIRYTGSPKSGGFIKYTQDENKYSFFGLLKMTDSYKSVSPFGSSIDIGTSYDLTLGLRYILSNTINLELKGENILDKSLNLSYYNSGGSNQITSYDIHPRAVSITLEMEF